MPKPTYLYVIEPVRQFPCGWEYSKIGITTKYPENRLKAIQTGSPWRLHMPFKFLLPDWEMAHAVEQATLTDFRDDGNGYFGEWVRAPAYGVLEVADMKLKEYLNDDREAWKRVRLEVGIAQACFDVFGVDVCLGRAA